MKIACDQSKILSRVCRYKDWADRLWASAFDFRGPTTRAPTGAYPPRAIRRGSERDGKAVEVFETLDRSGGLQKWRGDSRSRSTDLIVWRVPPASRRRQKAAAHAVAFPSSPDAGERCRKQDGCRLVAHLSSYATASPTGKRARPSHDEEIPDRSGKLLTHTAPEMTVLPVVLRVLDRTWQQQNGVFTQRAGTCARTSSYNCSM